MALFSFVGLHQMFELALLVALLRVHVVCFSFTGLAMAKLRKEELLEHLLLQEAVVERVKDVTMQQKLANISLLHMKAVLRIRLQHLHPRRLLNTCANNAFQKLINSNRASPSHVYSPKCNIRMAIEIPKLPSHEPFHILHKMMLAQLHTRK